VIVTNDKARKAAIRQRMAQTGETYSAARRGMPDRSTATAMPSPAEYAAGTGAEQQYAREALAAGVPADQVEAQIAAFRAQDAALAARESAEQAEREALGAEEHADFTHDDADRAREQSGDQSGWQRARERSEQAREAAEQARQRADDLEDAALEAEELAELAHDAANPAQRRGLAGPPFVHRRPGPGGMMVGAPTFLPPLPPPPPLPPGPPQPPGSPLPPHAPGSFGSWPWDGEDVPPADPDAWS
jgi:hypothetical protein